MPHEWRLLVEGDADLRRQEHRARAGWVSLILSAQCGKQVTAGQLLGEELLDDDIDGRAEQYQRELEKRLKREKRRKVKTEEV